MAGFLSASGMISTMIKSFKSFFHFIKQKKKFEQLKFIVIFSCKTLSLDQGFPKWAILGSRVAITRKGAKEGRF